jgi:proteasome lid subunit RPN8/RPN11
MITKAFRFLAALFGRRAARQRRRQARLLISATLWNEMIGELGRRGQGHRESGAFLLGPSDGDPRLITKIVYLDDLDPNCLTGAISFDGRYYSLLWDICHQQGLAVRADIHTHPGSSVRQSSIDRDNPMVARPGHLALIVPNLATGPVDPHDAGVHEYFGDAGWRSSLNSEAAQLLVITR